MKRKPYFNQRLMARTTGARVCGQAKPTATPVDSVVFTHDSPTHMTYEKSTEPLVNILGIYRF
jgi:hypothetical protein